jgi:hypothetical protein
MVQPPDDYLFKRKYIHGLPHSLVKSILEAHRISIEHSTIEAILEEVQHMETAHKAISLLTKHISNPGGKSSQAKSYSQNKRAKKGPHLTKERDLSILKRETPFIAVNQSSKVLTKGTTEGVEMNPKRGNNRAGSLTRDIHPQSSSMEFIALDVSKKDTWQINAQIGQVGIAQR